MCVCVCVCVRVCVRVRVYTPPHTHQSSVSHGLSEIIIFCWFDAQENFCLCVCVHVYVVYYNTNLYNDMGMTLVLQSDLISVYP